MRAGTRTVRVPILLFGAWNPERHVTGRGPGETERMASVRKAVIPAAGLGTRFLPATKAQAKEMIPVIDKPAIQYVVEEAAAAGLDDVLLITGRSKRAIEDHFDRSPELEASLAATGKTAELAMVTAIAELAHVHSVRQPEARGLGHAVSFAQRHVGREPFVVMLGDDLMIDATVLKQMIAAHEAHGCSVVALKRIPGKAIASYGCAAIDGYTDDGFAKITKLVEKPKFDEAPSDLAVMGRYLFTPTITSSFESIRACLRAALSSILSFGIPDSTAFAIPPNSST